MRKFQLLIWLSLLFCFTGWSQNRCGIDQAISSAKNHFPDYAQKIRENNRNLQTWLRNPGRFTNAQRTGYAEVTIPVVVHIVYNTAGQNIPDSQIVSQIEVLNEDFSRLNADAANTRNVFLPFAVDTKVRFCLASRDPQGNATNGITRTATNRPDFSFDDKVKFDSSGGKTGWNPGKYLNIWVCNLSTANGYAYYPGIPPEYDGVVVNYFVFGRIGNVVQPWHLGRTTTHEVGHYLGLYHPFEGYFAGTGCAGSDTLSCFNTGDYICDTPGDITPSYGCDTTENSCTDSPIDYPDQIENYMDYADDACNNMFTHDQMERMQGFLFTVRQSLYNSLGCVPPGSGYLDMAMMGIGHPVNSFCDTVFSPEVMVANVSDVSVSSFIINYQVEGGQIQQYNWAVFPLINGNMTMVTLPPLVVGSGNHSFTCWITDPNGQQDQNPVNDTLSSNFTILETGMGWMVPYSEGFEGGGWPPSGWRVDNPDSDQYTWEGSTEASGFGNSSTSATINNFYQGNSGTVDGLISPAFDFSAVPGAQMEFSVAYMGPQIAFYSDTLKVWYSLDCGTNWVLLWEKGAFGLETIPYQGFMRFVPSSQQWRVETIALNPVIGNPLVQFKFENDAGWGNDIWIDDINLSIPTNWESEIAGRREMELEMELYPIPSHDQLNVRVSSSTEKYQLENLPLVLYVFDLMGKKCSILAREESVGIGERKYSLNLESLRPGTYFIVLKNDENRVIRRFIRE